MDVITSPIVENFHNNDSDKIVSSANLSAEELSPETVKNGDSSANSSLNKMEPLLVEEDDDDGLGTESLRISGSEEEGDEIISPIRRKKRPTQQILESDEDDERELGQDVFPSNDKGEEGDEIQDSASATKEIHQTTNRPKKFSALIDSDSEPEETIGDIQEKTNNNNSTSDEENEAEENIVPETKRKKIKKKKGQETQNRKRNSPPKSSDSESDDESSHSKEGNKSSKISNLVDSDSESSNASREHEEGDQQGTKSATQRPKKPQRASAKKAMDEMQAIQSETQRLYRETQVNIPYHKPKRHTLKEFLTRHTIVKPTLNQVGPGKSLKMSPEELEEYAKHLEERAKEATEFFKSESEDELKNVQENETTDKQPDEVAMETSTSELKDSEVQPEATRPLNTEEIDQILQEHDFISQPTTQELLDIGVPNLSEPELYPTPSTSKANEHAKEPEDKPSSSSARPSALAELKRRLITEKNIPLVPTLKGDANMIIDFETGDMFARKPTGVENLFQRFIKSNKNNKKQPEEPTPSQELETTLKVAVIQESNKEKEPKPGAAYMKLKENLRTLINRKRKQEFQKKIEETKEEEEEYNKCCGLDDDDDEQEEDEERESKGKAKKMQHEIVIDEEENEIELEEYENEEDEDSQVELAEDKNKDEENEEETEAGEEENDENEENQENQAEDDDDNESDSSSSEEEQDVEDPSTRKHRVIKAFEDSDDEVNPELNATSTSVLFAEEEKKNPEEVENELLGLCSGQFAETQRASVISQIPITQTPGNVNETELEDLCSGVFNGETTQNKETQFEATEVEKTQKTVLRILSSDEEKEPDEEVPQSEAKKVKKLTKKKKKHVKLGFSDDEDDEDEEDQNSAEEIEADEEELPQTFIDYDSEENEIEVQMSKKDCVKQANAFLEKEAELSESEWGSADEDEQNLDKYDNELGDEDEFDQQKLHTELEQIHMRKVLDDDIREVKKIQEMLFDDEEADGVGRQRKFRWKNIENGFSLDDPAGGGADNDDKIDSADDEEEIKWRKIRFEREQFLMQKSKDEILASVSETDLGKKLLDTMKPNIKNPNFVIEKEVFVAKEYKPPSFLIKQNDLSILRNSVLNYDREALAKIAESIEKSGDYQRSDNEQVHKKASSTGNFVFAPLTEEEMALRKRKAEEEKNGNVAKKIKTCTNKSLFLDKLL